MWREFWTWPATSYYITHSKVWMHLRVCTVLCSYCWSNSSPNCVSGFKTKLTYSMAVNVNCAYFKWWNFSVPQVTRVLVQLSGDLQRRELLAIHSLLQWCYWPELELSYHQWEARLDVFSGDDTVAAGRRPQSDLWNIIMLGIMELLIIKQCHTYIYMNVPHNNMPFNAGKHTVICRRLEFKYKQHS